MLDEFPYCSPFLVNAIPLSPHQGDCKSESLELVRVALWSVCQRRNDAESYLDGREGQRTPFPVDLKRQKPEHRHLLPVRQVSDRLEGATASLAMKKTRGQACRSFVCKALVYARENRC